MEVKRNKEEFKLSFLRGKRKSLKCLRLNRKIKDVSWGQSFQMNGAVFLLQSSSSGRSHAVNVTERQRTKRGGSHTGPGGRRPRPVYTDRAETISHVRQHEDKTGGECEEVEEVRSCEENRLSTLYLTELVRTHRDNVVSAH